MRSPFKCFHQAFGKSFGPFKAVGRDVLGGHAGGNVEGDHHVHALAFHLLLFRPPLWVGPADEEQRQCHQQQPELYARPVFGGIGHQCIYKGRISHAGHGRFFPF